MHPVFSSLQMQELTPQNFDQEISSHVDSILCVFFWGHDCPNCEVAKNSLHREVAEIGKIPIKWFHVNTYEYMELGTRFGLHGIPTFIFFRNQRRLGKISPFPGIEAFTQAVKTLLGKF